MSQNCLNCNHPMHGPICSQCGQKQAQPIDAKRVIHDIWSHLLELDFKVIRAIRDLFYRPGALVNGYITGKRIIYTNPFKLLFFSATAYFLIIQFFDIRIDSFTHADKDIGRIVAAFLNYLLFLLLLSTAYFYRLIFNKKGLNFAESYVSLCYLWSGMLILSILVALLTLKFNTYYIPLKILVGITYLSFATHQIFKISLLNAFWKSLLVYVSYMLSNMLIILLMIKVANLLQFEPLMLSIQK